MRGDILMGQLRRVKQMLLGDGLEYARRQKTGRRRVGVKLSNFVVAVRVAKKKKR